MSWKCDACRKFYKYKHDGNPKNPRLDQMQNGIFICDKCTEIKNDISCLKTSDDKNIVKSNRSNVGVQQYSADNPALFGYAHSEKANPYSFGNLYRLLKTTLMEF